MILNESISPVCLPSQSVIRKIQAVLFSQQARVRKGTSIPPTPAMQRRDRIKARIRKCVCQNNVKRGSERRKKEDTPALLPKLWFQRALLQEASRPPGCRNRSGWGADGAGPGRRPRQPGAAYFSLLRPPGMPRGSGPGRCDVRRWLSSI